MQGIQIMITVIILTVILMVLTIIIVTAFVIMMMWGECVTTWVALV